LRNEEVGMGRRWLSRTLTPEHYSDDWNNPVRTMLLLRAWSVWRADRKGWASAKPGRSREQAMQKARLVEDIKSFQGGRVDGCLLGSKRAEAQLLLWLPGLAAELGASRVAA